MKCHLEPIVDSVFNSKSIRSNKRSYRKKYQINNQQRCIDCLKPRSNKNELECEKCGCNYFYVPNY